MRFDPFVAVLAVLAAAFAIRAGYRIWLRADRSRYEASLRRRIGPRDVWLRNPVASWSRTCWHCGEPCQTLATVELRQLTTVNTRSDASAGVALTVPICPEHGALRLEVARGVRVLSALAGIAIALVGPIVWGARGPVYHRPSAALLVTAIVLGATVALIGRRWARSRETLRLRYLDLSTGDAIVRLDDPRRAEAIRAEQARATDTFQVPGGIPRRIELGSPSLALHVDVVSVPNGGESVRCWSFRSEGLAAHGQAEIAILLAAHPIDQLDGLVQHLSQVLRSISDFAAKGQIVGPGDRTQLGVAGFLGGRTARGLVYTRPRAIEGVTLPSGALLAVLMLGDEIDAVNALGATRVLGRLGKQARYYPTPPWSDRGRTAAGAHAGDAASILGHVAKVNAPGVYARLEGTTILVHTTEAARTPLLRALATLPADAAFALIPEVDPDADALFVWHAGEQTRGAIAPEGSTGQRIALCFLAFMRDRDADLGQRVEDGAVMSLTPGSWPRVLDALRTGGVLSFPGAGDQLGLALAPAVERIASAVDGREMIAEGGWSTYRPQRPPPSVPEGTWRLRESVLLTPEGVLAQRVDGVALGRYADGIRSACQTRLGSRPRPAEVGLRVAVEPPGCARIVVACRGDVSEADVREAIAGQVPPPVTGLVELELLLSTHA